MITFKVETEREDDGRWLAEVVELPGVLAIAERLEHGEAGPELLSISFNAA